MGNKQNSSLITRRSFRVSCTIRYGFSHDLWKSATAMLLTLLILVSGSTLPIFR